MSKTYAVYVSDRMKELDLTQQQLATAVGLTQPTISRFLREQRKLAAETELRLLAAIASAERERRIATLERSVGRAFLTGGVVDPDDILFWKKLKEPAP